MATRDVSFVFVRKTEGSYWDKLNKGAKLTTLKCDWYKWKDEDEAKVSRRTVCSQPRSNSWLGFRRISI